MRGAGTPRRWAAAAVAVIAGCRGPGGDHAGPAPTIVASPAAGTRAAAVTDAAPAPTDAASIDAASIDAASIDAAEPAPVEVTARAPLELYARAGTGGRWRWASPTGPVVGAVTWTAGATEDDDWVIAVALTRGDDVLWSCAGADCDLACEAAQQRCDLGVVVRGGALIVASMSMNKLRFIPDRVLRFQWRRGQLVTSTLDGCAVRNSGIWDEYCSFQ